MLAEICSPFGIASFPVLDEVKGLDSTKGAKQLPALFLCQVVGQASHKHTLIGVYHLQ